MRLWMIVFCFLSVGVQAGAASTESAPAAVDLSCPTSRSPGAHLCSLVIQSIGIRDSGPGKAAELVATVAGSNPRCYRAPAPGTTPNVAGMTRRLLKSWRDQKPILLDSYLPEETSQGCEWLVRDALPCGPDVAQNDPPCLLHPSGTRYGGEPATPRSPPTALSESCEEAKRGTRFCSGFVKSIEPVQDTDRMIVHLSKPDICVTIDPAVDETNVKIWQAKLELVRAAKEQQVQAIVLFPTVPKAPAGVCPALYQIDILRTG